MNHKILLGGPNGNFAKVLGWNNINLCKVNEFFDNPFMKPVFEWINKMLNGVIKKCPYGPGYVKIENATIDPKDAETFGDKIQEFPNGYYKLIWIIFNSKDEHVVSGTMTSESNYRKNTLRSYDKF